MADDRIRVLVVEASPIQRRLLVDLINSAEDMLVVGQAANGVEAVRVNRSVKPHIIAMNLDLPLMTGLQATELIMQEHPNRIILLSDAEMAQDTEIVMQAHAAGALDVAPKPRAVDDSAGERLVKSLRALSKVGVVQRRGSNPNSEFDKYPGIRSQPEIVLMVSSTGGPHALGTILQNLPATFPLPIVIVQHIGEQFAENMVNWLNEVIPLRLKLAEDGERPLQGTVYLAPVGKHLRIAFNGQFLLEPDTEGRHHIPSGDILLESGAEVYGANAIGVILTGMGQDGVAGLLKLRQLGAPTIAQDEATSVVFGMPQEAIKRGAARYIEPITGIANLLIALAQKGKQAHG